VKFGYNHCRLFKTVLFVIYITHSFRPFL